MQDFFLWRILICRSTANLIEIGISLRLWIFHVCLLPYAYIMSKIAIPYCFNEFSTTKICNLHYVCSILSVSFLINSIQFYWHVFCSNIRRLITSTVKTSTIRNLAFPLDSYSYSLTFKNVFALKIMKHKTYREKDKVCWRNVLRERYIINDYHTPPVYVACVKIFSNIWFISNENKWILVKWTYINLKYLTLLEKNILICTALFPYLIWQLIGINN